MKSFVKNDHRNIANAAQVDKVFNGERVPYLYRVPDDFILGEVLNWRRAMMKMANVMMKYERIGLALASESVTSSEMLGVMELRLIHFRPARKSRERRETNSMLMILFMES